MKSSKCPKCSLVQWAENNICKRCATSLEPGTFAAAQQSNPNTEQPTWQQPVSDSQYGPPQLKTGLAVASMIIAIVSFPTTFLLIGLLLAPVALVMGIVALIRANKKPMEYGGKPFAIAGISVASVVCLFFVPLIAAIAIPNLLASRRAANEGSALAAMQKIALAQSAFSETEGGNDCGDIRSLATKGFIDAKFASGFTNGYKFVAGGSPSGNDGCEVRATPASVSEGKRSFYFSSSDNIIRVATNGMAATRNDPPMDQSSRASR
jgi:hypothetical protein